MEMISGYLYCLNRVLFTDSESSLFLLDGSESAGDCNSTVSFGRRRCLHVSSESYIIRHRDSNQYKPDYEIEKLEFNDGKCDYLSVLKSRGIAYEIPKSLPPSSDKMYTRFQEAIGDCYYCPLVVAFYGTNGWGENVIEHVGFDTYKNFEIHLNPDSFFLGEYNIISMSGEGNPDENFYKKLLLENNHMEEGAPFIEFMKESGIQDGYEYISLIAEDEKDS